MSRGSVRASVRGSVRGSAPAAPLAVLVAGLAAVAFVASVDPEQPGHYPTCPFLALTGWWCPGCGSLRAVHALTRGDFGTALDRNVLTVLAIPALLIAWAAWLRRALTGTSRTAAAVPVAAIWAVLGVVVAFWTLRNLPAGAWLAPT
jgi:hypothetical protein